MRKSVKKIRCWWCEGDELYQKYHDLEWGKPVHNDIKIFEMLILEGFQAGLSWLTILRKRRNFRKAFCNFNPKKVAKLTNSQLNARLKDPGIIRNRLKVYAARSNAQAFLEVQKEFGTFDRYIWQFTNYKTIRTKKDLLPRKIPATSKESDALSKDLKKRGFKFVGSTICYAHMQATGMIDDHVKGCFRYVKR